MRKRGVRQFVGFSVVLFFSLVTSHQSLVTDLVWADEDTDALKAEIQALKSRLSQLEQRLTQAELKGVAAIGEKEGVPGLLQLPSGLQGLGISGYADVSYIYNFAESDAGSGRTNRGRVFDTESNGFTPHAFELVFEKPITDQMPIGFRADLFAGDDADTIGSTGLTDVNDAEGTDNDQIDLQQAYITAKAPIGDGIEFKVGKFVTLLGAEVIESPANWNFSRSYMFGYSIPFTHTGVLASYPLPAELGSATFGVVNGWDIVDDNNKAKSLIGNITLTPLEGVTLSFNGITGAEQASDSRNKRTVFDFVGTWQPLEKLTLMANYDFGHESGIVPATALTRGYDSVEWAGLALYGKYDLTPIWSLAGRWEWFDDKNNVRTNLSSFDSGTPPDIDFYEWTLTSQWKLYEHVLARLEYRHDFADQRVFFHDKVGFSNHQDTIAAELIYHF